MVEAEANGVQPGALVAVGKVQDSLPTPDLKGVRALVDSQTKSIGVIQPPPDIRAIVDKTAQFVAKNGANFEGKILSTNQGNAKFNFLRSTDPYHDYYQHKVKEFQAGDGEAAAPADQAQQAQQAILLQQAVQPAAVSLAAPVKPLEKPEPDIYTVPVPEGLLPIDVDIIKLTAQFVARNGGSFMTGLLAREQSNAQFNFMKPTHSLFGFFTSLCEAYAKVLMPDKDIISQLEKRQKDSAGILEKCLRRLEWENVREAEAKEAADQIEAERAAMHAIDWHDFVVVETIDFDEDEDVDLPLPMTQKDVVVLNKAGPQGYAQEEAAEPGKEGEAEAAEAAAEGMDEVEKALVLEGQTGGAEGAAAAEAPLEAPKPPEEDTDMVIEEEEPSERKIVRNYQRVDPRSRTYDPTKFVVSPITGELVELEKMAEHMRISLIDPQWKEQRDAMLAKVRETTKASDDEIGRNLEGLARNRPDVFGSTQEELSSIVQQSIENAKISGGDRPVVWDGQTKGGVDLSNQVKAIEESRAGLAKRKEPEAAPAPAIMLGPKPGLPQIRPPQQPLRPPMGGMLPGPPMGVRPPFPMPASLPGPPPMQQQQMMQMRPPMPPQMQMRPPPPQGGYGMGMQQQQMMPPMRPPMMGGPPSMMQQQRPPPPRPQMQPPMPGMPPMPMQEPPPLPRDEQAEAKRQRTEFVLQPEDEFLEQFPGSSMVEIQLPRVEGSERLDGRLLQVEVPSLRMTVGELKARLADTLDLPSNKQAVSREGAGFLKDEYSLAFYNVGPSVQLSLRSRERGGTRRG